MNAKEIAELLAAATRQTADDNEAEMAAVGVPPTDAELAADERLCANLPVTPEATDAYRQRACTRYPALVAEVRRLRDEARADLAAVKAERDAALVTRNHMEAERRAAFEGCDSIRASLDGELARVTAERDCATREATRLRFALARIASVVGCASRVMARQALSAASAGAGRLERVGGLAGFVTPHPADYGPHFAGIPVLMEYYHDPQIAPPPSDADADADADADPEVPW